MKIEIKIDTDKLVTKYGDVPFNPALKCPVSGTQMKLRSMEAYADSDESYKYINYLVVKEGNEESPKTKALIAAFANQDVVDFINATYPGSVIPSADLVK